MMASIVYTAILFVFIFGASLSYINETGLYSTQLPASGTSTDIERANQTQLSMQKEAENPSVLSAWNQIGIMFRAIWGGVVALFTIGFLLESFGIPAGLVGFLISPLAIILVFWLFEYWLGRPAE
jgi:hypothetical protein